MQFYSKMENSKLYFLRLTLNLENSKLDVIFSIMFKQATPTIVVLEGVVFGGRLELARSCDLRICGSDSNLHPSYA
jgi:enoyl-CoA hydratase/carnithine racemase